MKNGGPGGIEDGGRGKGSTRRDWDEDRGNRKKEGEGVLILEVCWV